MSDDIKKTELVAYMRRINDGSALSETLREARALKAETESLRAENARLRELVEGMEEELKEIGAVSWRTPDQKAVDADLMREDAHERKRLEKEYPWKE